MSTACRGVAIGPGFVSIFAGALDVRGYFGLPTASSIMLGLFLMVFGTSFFVSDKRQKTGRCVSFWFLGAAVVLLAIALAHLRS